MNEIQTRILKIIDIWKKNNSMPITLKEITLNLPDVKPRTVRASAESLCTKGYLRRGINIKNNSCYILIRTMSYE